MNYTGYQVIGNQQRPAGHSLRQLLRYLDQLDTMLGCKGADDTGPNI
jgi:hypothetical protein